MSAYLFVEIESHCPEVFVGSPHSHRKLHAVIAYICHSAEWCRVFVELNGWVSGYSSALKSVGYYPQTFMYDISRFIQAKKDLEQGKQADVNEKDAKLFQFLSKLLQVKDNLVYAIPIDVSVQRGSSLESAELSEFEQEMVDSGMANIEDYTGYGSFVDRLVIDKINTRKRVKNAGKDGFKNGRLEVASVDVFRKHTITPNEKIGRAHV